MNINIYLSSINEEENDNDLNLDLLIILNNHVFHILGEVAYSEGGKTFTN